MTYTYGSSMKALVGKRITGIFVGTGDETLLFKTDKGDVVYSTDADCCSETWFADITGVDNLLGAIVRQAEDIENPDTNTEDGRTRQQDDKAYGVKLVTDRGYADIIYRNSSNGYYGGSISKDDHGEYSTEGMKKITDDWSATGSG